MLRALRARSFFFFKLKEGGLTPTRAVCDAQAYPDKCVKLRFFIPMDLLD
jgi:hypothetical protein